MRLLPRKFTMGLKNITGQFIRGVWEGMGPGPKLKTGKRRVTRRVVNPYVPKGLRDD